MQFYVYIKGSLAEKDHQIFEITMCSGQFLELHYGWTILGLLAL